MAYPTITLKQCDYAQITQNKTGDLAMVYKPLLNLVKNTTLGDFTTESFNFDRYNALDMLIVDEFDGSTNIIINDDHNLPRLINSGFAVLEGNTFLIPEHYTNSVTNIYDDTTFALDTLLLKLYNKIPILKFEGFGDGAFPCGSYVFYFRLADSVGNMSNIIQHSSVIQVFIGENGSYLVRMGMLDENAGKSIKFKLSEIDSGFDYLRVFYERTSSSNDLASNTTFHMVNLNFPIINGVCTVMLTGEEETLSVPLSDLKNEYADIAACKTLAVVDNTLFLANTEAYVHDYALLLRMAWSIYATMDSALIDLPAADASGTANGYYDPINVYSRVGYWPDEYYRFGIVFIYNNNLLSPVFNIHGYDMLCTSTNPHNDLFPMENGKRILPDYEPEDYIFNRTIMANSKGVIRTIKTLEVNLNLFLNFHIDSIGDNYIRYSPDVSDLEREYYTIPNTSKYDIKKYLNERHGIKGFFFVRQKRIPTTLALGIVVGLTTKEHGSIPILRDGDKVWKTKSFLSKDRLILPMGSTVTTSNDDKTSRVVCQALLVPDAELQEATYNQLFTSQEYALFYDNSCQFKILSDDMWWLYNNTKVTKTIPPELVKLTAVPRDTKVVTNGTDFFSTVAGSAEEAFKTEDIYYVWDRTKPLDLTTSTSLIRGKWGYYVGMSSNSFDFGDIVSIKKSGFAKDPELLNNLEFLIRFADHSFYSPVSTRYSIDVLLDKLLFSEYGGDCFPSIFTHRMMTNFVDPELPTNTKIINPGCWCENYAVRCTAEILQNTSSNLVGESAGFYVPSTNNSNLVSLIFGILTGNLGSIITSITNMALGTKEPDGQEMYANEIALAFEVYIGNRTGSYGTNTSGMPLDPFEKGKMVDSNGIVKGTYDTGGWSESNDYNTLMWAAENGRIQKVNPKELEQNASGLNLKALFKSDDKWELHGTALINRADINAVSFGLWITFPVRSSVNLALRDIDFNLTTEEAKFNKKRSFYPLEKMDPFSKLHESNVINSAIKKTIHKNNYPVYKTVPFIKLEYFNRIYWSKPNIADSFLNSYRMIYTDLYKEYNKEFGSITKILPIKNNLLTVFEHGIGILPVDRSIKTETEASPYLASRNVLPSLLSTISKDFGSKWKNSIIQTPKGIIYGVDTVAKKIWRTLGSEVEFISDHFVTKFLNDNIDLSEFDARAFLGHIDVKTHYNNFKNDVIFTFVKDVPTYSTPNEEKELEIREWMRAMWDINKLSCVYFGEYKEGLMAGNGSMTVIYGGPTTIYDSAFGKNVELTDSYCDGFTEVSTISVGGEIRMRLDYPDHTYKTLGTEYSIATIEIQSGKVYINDLFTGIWLDVDHWDPGTVWSLCYNEILQKWITFYDWYPVESCNVDNIYFSFDLEQIDPIFENIPKYWYPDLGNTSSMVSNKYFIDKTFADKVDIYRFAGSTYLLISDLTPEEWIVDMVTNPTYLSFYYKGATVPTLDGALPKYISDTYTQDGWQFVIYELTSTTCTKAIAKTLIQSSTNWRLNFASETDVIEVKVFNMPKLVSWNEYLKLLFKEKPHLQYMEIRDYNPNRMYLWKHGQSGIFDNLGVIKPTNWYGKQHEFNFEFVVNDVPIRQKIFNNLKIVSNKTKPKKFEYEIVGEGYEWWPYKPVIFWANENTGIGKPFPNLYSAYTYILSNNTDDIRKTYPDFPETDLEYRALLTNSPYEYRKIPYIKIELTDRKGRKDRSYHATDAWSPYAPVRNVLPRVYDYTFNTNETSLLYDLLLNEYRIHDELLGNDMTKYGRVRGNMQYLEDLWDIEIRPISFTWLYKNLNEGGVLFTKTGTFTPAFCTTKNLIYNFTVRTTDVTTITITETTLDGEKLVLSYSFTAGTHQVLYLAKETNSILTFHILTTGKVRFPHTKQGDNHLLLYLTKTLVESRHRDKYIKVKVRYSGEDLVLILLIYTLFDESYA